MNIRIRSLISGLVALVLLAGIVVAPAKALAVTNQSIAAPVFEKPGTNTYWDDVRNAGSSSVPFIVANPANGPGPAIDSVFSEAIAKNTTAKVRTLGYIQTNFQTRPFKETYNDIDAWYRMYPQTSGMYIDLVKEGGQAEVCYTAALYSHVKNARPNDLVVLSPGTHISPAYEPYGDIFVNANMDYATYTTWQPQHKGFEDKTQYQNRFWHIVHDVSTDQYSSAFADVRDNNAGWVFMTDKSDPAPFNATPSFWQNEKDDVNALPESAIPNRGKTSLPRGCISLSASAESTVDTRTAKQSTTSSTITINNTSPTYNSDPATAVKLMSLPKGTTITSLKAPGWDCTAADFCQYNSVLSAASSAPVVTAALQADCAYAGGDAVLRLTNYTGNQWDLKLPIRAPYGCNTESAAVRLNSDSAGLITTITTQSIETTPDITPLGANTKVVPDKVTKKSENSAALIAVLIVILVIILGVGITLWILYLRRKREAYSVKL